MQSAVCGQTENWESRSWTSSPHSQRSTVAHKLFFKYQRLWTGCSRGEALTCAGKTRLLTESDSLAQGRTRTLDTRPRCDLANTYDSSESDKARDLVLATHRERYL